MLFHKEISDFIRSGGIDVREASLSNQKIFLARSAQTGRIIAVLPVCVSARDPYSAGIQSEVTFSIIKRLKEEYGSYPLVVTEDRWRRQQDMMKARVLAHLGVFDQIYARNCEVRKIDKKTAAEFLEAHHSYSDAACRYRYGLFIKGTDDLMAVAAFSNARKWQKEEKVICSYEWTRYASVPEVRVIGGMGKLLNAFIKDVDPDDIMSYADLEWSEGEVYGQLGFRLEGHKDPVLFEVDSQWRRFPVRPGTTEEAGKLYFRNLGSNKYRLKLTDYR